MSFGPFYHHLQPSFKLLSNDLGREGHWTLPTLGLMVTNTWGPGTFYLPAWPPCWEPSSLFAEVVCRKKVHSGVTQTHCWEPYMTLLSTPHLADGFNPPTESNLVRIAFCTMDLLCLCHMEKLEDGNFLDCGHFFK